MLSSFIEVVYKLFLTTSSSETHLLQSSNTKLPLIVSCDLICHFFHLLFLYTFTLSAFIELVHKLSLTSSSSAMHLLLVHKASRHFSPLIIYMSLFCLLFLHTLVLSTFFVTSHNQGTLYSLAPLTRLLSPAHRYKPSSLILIYLLYTVYWLNVTNSLSALHKPFPLNFVHPETQKRTQHHSLTLPSPSHSPLCKLTQRHSVSPFTPFPVTTSQALPSLFFTPSNSKTNVSSQPDLTITEVTPPFRKSSQRY